MLDLDNALRYLSEKEQIALLKLKCRNATAHNKKGNLHITVYVHPNNLKCVLSLGAARSVWFNIEELIISNQVPLAVIALAQLGFTKENPHGC